jgi:hypothetical protein
MFFLLPKTKSPRFHPVAEILFGVEEKKEKIMKKNMKKLCVLY